jgi:glycosyltransferase involved in cell wall biosynthesis
LLGNVRLREIFNVAAVKSRLLRFFLLLYVSFSPIGHFIALRRESDRLYFANAGHWPQIGVYLIVAKLCGYKTALLIHDVMPHRMLFPAALRRVERACLRVIYNLADKLVVHHAGAVADLAALGLTQRDKIAVIPHGLFDLPSIPVRAPSDDDGLRLLLFGQIRANKNILPSVAAVQSLRAQGQNVVLRICGRASRREAAYLAACRAAIAAHPDGITLEDRFIAESELPALVGWCDAFLLPYGEFYSQSGVATLALANGKPIIASTSGGLAELLTDGENGIEIATAHDAVISEAAIADAIRRANAIGQDGLIVLGERGRARLAASSAWSVVGRLHAAMIDSLRAPAQA